MGEKLREINFDVLAEMRAEGEGMTGIPKPPIERTLVRMPESLREITMQPNTPVKLK